MSSARRAGQYDALRRQPLWQLLAADNAPQVLAILENLWLEQERTLLSSIAQERLTRELTRLREEGYNLPQTAQSYLYEWLKHGWLERRLRVGSSEEEYELSAPAVQALRFAQNQLKPRNTATESRLTSVIEQVSHLAEETNNNPEARLARLLAERERLDKEIEQTRAGHIKTLTSDQALERAREIISLVEDLAVDFHRVRDGFDKLNRQLRTDILQYDESRSRVLEALFNGVDLIAESEEGKTFNAFWRLLTDNAQSATLLDALDEVLSRPFARRLDPEERKFLHRLTDRLMTEGSLIHEVQTQFARSLRTFVQSSEFQEQRRLQTVLKQAQQAALGARDTVSLVRPLPFHLTLTVAEFSSAGQLTLHDPELHAPPTVVTQVELPPLDLSQIDEMVRQSDIDFPQLKRNLLELLRHRSQVSVGEVLTIYPATQGLGSVIGYVALALNNGDAGPAEQKETVFWTDRQGSICKAALPLFYFVKERASELR